MVRQFLPLNGLRAFEASARHLSFTRAAIELCVTQAAVSQQVKGLEKRLGVALFQRLPRGLKITAEGEALLPTVTSSFDQMATTLDRIEAGQVRELLFLGVVGTFAVGWLLPRLQAFQKQHPFIDVRVSTNNNRVDMAAEGLDFAIRFGQGSWHGTDAFRLFEAPLSPLCTPKLAETLKTPADLMETTLLRSYRADEWSNWFAAAGVTPAAQVNAGIVFDTSLGMMEAALQGLGVALAPPSMFSRHLASGAIIQPFPVTISLGSYWLTRLQSKPPTPAMQAFSDWMFETMGTAV
ncbi:MULTISPECIES: LysR substrate-binding domain-containing protein [Agrobacterium tumefaciens complex]|jgi:LysR family transcriptional regulator of beta-lactamase|uniref:LysR substrate-binding domain-containing protein n=1 Tax=Agrobacterium tumefaciens complex TaxID=1183400 RepID=UPI000761AAFF|nr:MULTISPECIES: LysR substrate-binding domain-containing protein [Agrobacterium tumefaciens complex]KAB0456334.1 LysR family transcriptional regulator [Agrobacterium tumefaciens]KWT79471.1 LysR family transcriptional regulator [Agrobacterium radiobacter]MBP2542365.1 LysR family transcriptional regulator of beta-lactamase [Agrobacterium tumefaciens]MBP2570469.1 LysR family transcriptional regulator of beta-lactamase [Agrobacterium tumefaciens]NIB12597.1 LysR family transcriptional regulator [A